MKRLLPGLISLAMFFTLSACGGSGAQAEFDPAADTAALLETSAFSESLTEIDTDTACMLYGIDGQTVTDSAVYGSTGATAEEVAIFALDSESAAAAALEALELRVSDRMEALADYQPQEIGKLESAVVEQRGATVLLVVAADYTPVDNLLGE